MLDGSQALRERVQLLRHRWRETLVVANRTDVAADVDDLEQLRGAATFTAPPEGEVFEAPATVAFQWSGPSEFASLTFSLYERDPFQFLLFQSLNPGVTSFTPDPLGSARYGADVRYVRSAEQWVSISQPTRQVNGQAVPLEGWEATSSLNSVAFVTFDVVPEPGAWAAATAGGLAGFALWRSRRSRYGEVDRAGDQVPDHQARHRE